jgi:hypothetical protein
MSAAFFMAGIHRPASASQEPASLVSELFQHANLPLGRLNVVHWFSAQEQSLMQSSIPAGVPGFTWLPQPMNEHFILQAVCRALANGDQELALLGSSGAWGLSVVLLASPQVAGRYNVLPAARFVAGVSLPVQEISSVKDRLEDILQAQIVPEEMEVEGEEGQEQRLKEPEPIELSWLAGEVEGVTAPAARILPPEGDPLCQFNALMQSLAQEQGSYGLLVQRSAGAALASLFEGV